MTNHRALRLRGSRVDRSVRQPYLPPDQPDWYIDDQRGCSPASGNSGLFTSESRGDRNEAIRICKRRCPFQRECYAQAVKFGEVHHVWGGKDFTASKADRKARVTPAQKQRADEEATVRKLWGEGLGDADIARVTALSANKVWGIRRRLDLPAHPRGGRTQAELEPRIAELWEKGVSDRDMGLRLGVSEDRIGRIRREVLGLPTHHRSGGRAARQWLDGTPYDDGTPGRQLAAVAS